MALNTAKTEVKASISVSGTICGVGIDGKLSNPGGDRVNETTTGFDENGWRSYEPSLVILENSLPLGRDDGAFLHVAKVYWEWEYPQPQHTYGMFEVTKTLNVPKWIRIIGSSWSPNSTNVNGSSTFTISVEPSTNCNGAAAYQSVLTQIPAGLAYTWGTSGWSPTDQHTMTVYAGEVSYGSQLLDLNGGLYGGAIRATASLLTAPTGCTVFEPSPSGSSSANLTVTAP